MITIQEYLLSKSKPKLNTIKATDETIHQIVKDELDRFGHDADLNHIDVSKVTNMSKLFCCYEDYLGPKYNDLNPDISKWDVSNVVSMDNMFYGCVNFNCDISSWIVSNVVSMGYMFYHCENFNQDISQWDVSKAVTMWYMFLGCKKFNQDISGWNVGNVWDMRSMFWGCEKFNQDLSGWDVSKVEYNKNIFQSCPIKEEYKPKFKK